MPTTAKKTSTTSASKATTKKAAATAPLPATHRRLTDREKAAREKEREREKVANAKTKAREKEKVAKAKEREAEMKVRAREREQEKKEKKKLRVQLAKVLKKPYPLPPKRPATGYILFASDPNVKRDRGKGVATHDAIMAGAAWRALSDAEREAYNKKSREAHPQWKEDVAKWVASLNFAQLTAARANREPGTRDESALKILPKRPGNNYAMFLADVGRRPDFCNRVEALARKESGGDDTKFRERKFVLFGRTLAATWKSMAEKEKAVYAARSADATKQWEKNYGSIIAAQKEALVSAYT